MSEAAAQAALADAVHALRSARKVVALSGAGISVASGIPDFRSPGGLWEDFPPEVYATIEGFLSAPDRSWQLFRALGKTLVGKLPNDAHRALAELESSERLAGIITQNIDGLHQAAGSRVVHEVHGSHQALECRHCSWREAFRDELLEDGPVPACPECDVALKPAVVLFGEAIREVAPIEELLAGCDLLIVVGTSAQVYPVAAYPEAVLASGGRVIDINIEPTPLAGRPGVISLEGDAAEVLRDVVDRLAHGNSGPGGP